MQLSFFRVNFSATKGGFCKIDQLGGPTTQTKREFERKLEMARKVWFITGASEGFGMELTKAAIDAGGTVSSNFNGSRRSCLPSAVDRLRRRDVSFD